jgi:hypothetical protein
MEGKEKERRRMWQMETPDCDAVSSKTINHNNHLHKALSSNPSTAKREEKGKESFGCCGAGMIHQNHTELGRRELDVYTLTSATTQWTQVERGRWLSFTS